MASLGLVFFGFVIALPPNLVEEVEDRSLVAGWDMVPMLAMQRLMTAAEPCRERLKPRY
ncbi:MAG: hypothetical protein ACOYM2_17885 [Rectinemataceae bacterium]